MNLEYESVDYRGAYVINLPSLDSLEAKD